MVALLIPFLTLYHWINTWLVSPSSNQEHHRIQRNLKCSSWVLFPSVQKSKALSPRIDTLETPFPCLSVVFHNHGSLTLCNYWNNLTFPYMTGNWLKLGTMCFDKTFFYVFPYHNSWFPLTHLFNNMYRFPHQGWSCPWNPSSAPFPFALFFRLPLLLFPLMPCNAEILTWWPVN